VAHLSILTSPYVGWSDDCIAVLVCSPALNFKSFSECLSTPTRAFPSSSSPFVLSNLLGHTLLVSPQHYMLPPELAH
jgi:hypothetical protein